MRRILIIPMFAVLSMPSVSGAICAPFFFNVPSQLVMTFQDGNMNKSLQAQQLKGHGHQVSIVGQQGEYNQSVTIQSGSQQGALIAQDGNDNAAAIGQDGSAQVAGIVHNGNLNTGGISQVGEGQAAFIISGN